jgi:hypothetical protein
MSEKQEIQLEHLLAADCGHESFIHFLQVAWFNSPLPAPISNQNGKAFFYFSLSYFAFILKAYRALVSALSTPTSSNFWSIQIST